MTKRWRLMGLVLASLLASAASYAQDNPPPANPPQDPASDSQAQPATPAVTVNVGEGTAPSAAPAKDQAQEEAKPAAAPKPRPFSGTQVFMQSSMSTPTVFRGQQQYANDTIDGSIWLLPRYALNKDFQLRGRMIFSYEFTNSDTTTTKNEPRFSDATTQLFYRGIPAFAGIKPMVGAQLGFPLSPESQARTMIVSPGAILQLSRSFEHVLGGEIMLLSSAIYTHPFYRYTTPGVDQPTPYAFQCLGGTTCSDQLSGVANPSDIVSWTAMVAGEWGKFSPALFFLGSHQWAYRFRDIDGVQRLEDPSNVRQSIYFSGWLDYHLNSWLTPEVGYFMSRNVLTERSRYGNPVFDRYQDTRVYLGLNVNIDALMQQIEGGGGEAGVVRARNKYGPSLAF